MLLQAFADRERPNLFLLECVANEVLNIVFQREYSIMTSETYNRCCRNMVKALNVIYLNMQNYDYTLQRFS